MASPTAPTANTLVVEALKKAGYSDPATNQAALVTRATDYWMEEIKNDVYIIERQLVSLQKTNVQITTNGLSRYSMPTDFGTDMHMTLLDGSNTGQFQVGSSTTSWILDTDDTTTEANAIGKEILVYSSSTALGQIGQVTAYNTTTFTATVSGCTVAPALNDYYFWIDTYTDLPVDVLSEYDLLSTPTTTGTPNRYYFSGDSDNGEFLIYPNPYRSSEIPFGIRQRYYADLMRLDLASTTMSTIYQRWRNLFIQGVYAKCLQWKDDNRAKSELASYGGILNAIVNREKYGADVNAEIKFSPEYR